MLPASLLPFALEPFDETGQPLAVTHTSSAISTPSLYSSWSSVSGHALQDDSSDATSEDSSNYEEGSLFVTPWTSTAGSVVSLLRESHDDPNSPYCLPADDQEKLRLDEQHNFIRDHICDGRLVLDDAMTLKDGSIVLDLGTGSGAWASDLACRVPSSVKILGFDISDRLFPPESSNVTFSLGNVLALPEWLQSRATLAHQRLLIYALRRQEWSQAIESIKNTLIPGEGRLQLTEVLTPAENPGAAQEKFHTLLSS